MPVVSALRSTSSSAAQTGGRSSSAHPYRAPAARFLVAARPPSSSAHTRYRLAAAASTTGSQEASDQQTQQQQPRQQIDDVRRPGGGAESDVVTAELAAFLREDLQHLFDDQGIDASRYDEVVVFEDPITKYSSLSGYLFNISMLRHLFSPVFILHDIRRTGEWELTTRWTMSMQLTISPLKSLWSPQLTFTGTSVMGINPATRRFRSHRDTWDAVQRQEYFSLEAFTHMLSQLMDLKRPARPVGPFYEVLRKTADYEVRRYDGVATLEGLAAASGSSGVGSGSGDIGSASASSSGSSTGGGGLYAVAALSGTADEARAAAEAERLRAALERDGIKAAGGSDWQLAQPSDPATPPPFRRNEVLLPLAEFDLWH